eukprot:1826311-Pyramimonas_sp.AAC.1
MLCNIRGTARMHHVLCELRGALYDNQPMLGCLCGLVNEANACVTSTVVQCTLNNTRCEIYGVPAMWCTGRGTYALRTPWGSNTDMKSRLCNIDCAI